MRGGKLPNIFFEMVQQEQLEDIWRKLNKNVKDFTYYSASKKSSSRLDMIWISKRLTIHTKKIEILPKVMSDHNPIIWINKCMKKKLYWRLNEDLLN